MSEIMKLGDIHDMEYTAMKDAYWARMLKGLLDVEAANRIERMMAL